MPLIEPVVRDLLRLLSNPAVTFKQVVGRLTPEIAVRFLSAANRVPRGRRVSQLSFAVKMLGFGRMRRILESAPWIAPPERAYGRFSFEKCHRQAEFCQTIAGVLGEMVGAADPETLTTAAALHNIGKLVIAFNFGEESLRIIEARKRHGLTMLQAEQRILGCDHGVIGGTVLSNLGLPPAISDAARFHESALLSVPRSAHFQTVMIVAKASEIVHAFALPKMEPDRIRALLMQKTARRYRTGEGGSTPARPWPAGREAFLAILDEQAACVASCLEEILRVQYIIRQKKMAACR